MYKTYKHVTASGTFDHFHIGHEEFLMRAFRISEHVSIGISHEQVLKNKQFSSQIQDFETRKNAVVDFLKKNKVFHRATLFTLADIYGIAKSDKTLEGIIVTAETRKNANIINNYRKKHSLEPVDIIQIDFIKSKDNKIVSSTRIRSGELTQNGEQYINLFQRYLELPQNMRKEMRDPFGIVVEGNDHEIDIVAQKAKKIIESMNATKIITVGDIATISLKKQGLLPDIEIIDFKTKRSELVINTEHTHLQKRIRNKAGTISKKAVSTLYSKLKKIIRSPQKHTIIIQGEEDLLALPAILLSPLGSVVVYGQFNKGLILVPVTESVKQNVQELVSHFT